ncbi:hypothetical protein [Paraburkholderia hospita]|uniref:hypothetical protein n=1 Tax=Paraburkholderia hospita TaxID=169430 RepID=UPI000271822C|nr:hypothetical protein [Paraburkholderia hospita]EUC18392.1 hypothetical protein PMI06_003357 [Burkholderia sp. BT03]SKC77032.1 hypothetical protein SAMN06266956_3007 [Paraburkholderia hospita]
MNNPSIKPASDVSPWANRTSPSNSLLELLLSDVATDVEVVTRELGLRNEMLERLRRALDRLDCAQAVLAAMSAGSVGASDDEWALRMRDAVELLAREWPEDYPAGVVEWLLLGGRHH